MEIKQVIGAKTAQSNNWLTDKEPLVHHLVDVIYEDGTKGEIKLLAGCPIDAIEKIHEQMEYQ
tara:strand:+ start:731 stop:919 length:189 start_codon:yes stop_codon:yes gene_type:complete